MSAYKPNHLWMEVCAAEHTLSTNFAALCGESAGMAASPLDDFYTYVTGLIPIGSRENLATHPALGHTLLLGLVSGSELYFRRVLAGLINICPLCRQSAARQQLSLGAVDYYGKKLLGLGLLENVSVAGSGEIRKQTTRLVGIDIPGRSSLDQAIVEFERLCELRHAATHARGHLGHQNLRDLGITVRRKRLALKVEPEGLHTAAAVCQNVVRAYNRHVFRRVVERWLASRLLSGNWKKDRARFSQLHTLFRSTSDRVGPTTAYRAFLELRPVIQHSVRVPLPPAQGAAQ